MKEPLARWVKKALETIDAALFNGDTFRDEVALKTLEEYLFRWNEQAFSMHLALEKKNEDWWKMFYEHQEHISNIVSLSKPNLSSAFSIAIQQKNRNEVFEIMDEAWTALPPDLLLKRVPGWGALWDLCDMHTNRL